MVEPLFEFCAAKSHDAVSQAIEAAGEVSTASYLARDWRVTSALSIRSELENKICLKSDLDWLVGEDRRDEAKGKVQLEIDELENRLRAMSVSQRHPTRLRLVVRDKLCIRPEDQTVSVSAGISLKKLQEALGKVGQCVPIGLGERHNPLRIVSLLRMHHALDFDLPHTLQAQHGSWKDWVLGMTVVLGDGTIVKAGSGAVKNVAGYDVHKLIVGARGALGVIVEVTLRTTPLSALQKSQTEAIGVIPESSREWAVHNGKAKWIQRTLPTDFSAAVRAAGNQLIEVDWASHTLYAFCDKEDELLRYPGDWVIRSGCGEKNLQISDPLQIKLMKRAKAIFDPTNKLNPGEWGFM